MEVQYTDKRFRLVRVTNNHKKLPINLKWDGRDHEIPPEGFIDIDEPIALHYLGDPEALKNPQLRDKENLRLRMLLSRFDPETSALPGNLKMEVLPGKFGDRIPKLPPATGEAA